VVGYVQCFEARGNKQRVQSHQSGNHITYRMEKNIFELAQIHLPLSVCSVQNCIKRGTKWEYVKKDSLIQAVKL
jgi:hypothetical protein